MPFGSKSKNVKPRIWLNKTVVGRILAGKEWLARFSTFFLDAR